MFTCDRCGDFPDLRPRRSTIPPVTDEAAPIVPPKRNGRPRVLLVDDSQEQRDLYALMLETRVTVMTASRGEDGLALASTERPDTVILDVMMPGMDGWEVCERLKSNPATASIPVIMLTAIDSEEVQALARRAGATAVLVKPCSVERLVLTISEALGQSVSPG